MKLVSKKPNSNYYKSFSSPTGLCAGVANSSTEAESLLVISADLTGFSLSDLTMHHVMSHHDHQDTDLLRPRLLITVSIGVRREPSQPLLLLLPF